MRPLLADFVLFLTAILWGSGFIAQRLGMGHMGPFAFNGARFLLAAALILPWNLRWLTQQKSLRAPLYAAGVGTLLFLGASLQQLGLVTTSAGKAGFLTSIYTVLVAFMGLFMNRKPQAKHWLGALLAVAGTYFLSMENMESLAVGDLAVLLGAVAWAAHILMVDKTLSAGVPALGLAGFQFLFCGLLSLLASLVCEGNVGSAMVSGYQSILYSGGIVVALGYTLQLIGQKAASPSHAAILLSLEAVFAAFFGWLMLSENMTPRALAGCALIFLAVVVCEWRRAAPCA